MKVAIYARVSHDDKVQDPEVQLASLRRYCERMQYEYNEYSDKETGRTLNRDDYKRLWNNIDQYEGIVVEYADRLTREGPSVGIPEVQKLLSLNKFFEISSGGIQVHGELTATMQLMLEMLFSLAAFQSNLISEKTREGMRHKRPEDGWSWEKVTPEIEKDVMFYYSKGLSTRQIAARIESISASTVSRIINQNI